MTEQPPEPAEIPDQPQGGASGAVYPKSVMQDVMIEAVNNDKPGLFAEASWESTRLYEAAGIKPYRRVWEVVSKYLSPQKETEGPDTIYTLPLQGNENVSRADRMRLMIGRTASLEYVHLLMAGTFNVIGASAYIAYDSISDTAVAESAQPTTIVFGSMFACMQVALNAYPMALQRYNRLRSRRALAGIEARQ